MNDFSPIHQSFSDTDSIPTGFADIDAMLAGGWLPGQLIVVGGRYGSGNTDLALDFARAAATADLPTAIISLFLTTDEVVRRLLAATTSLAHERLAAKELADWESDLIQRGTAELQSFPLYVDKERVRTVEELTDRLRRAYEHHQLRMIVVDSFQMLLALHHDPSGGDGEHIGRLLKALARELRLPIILVVDLEKNKDRPDQRPIFGDLSDVGKLDWFADTVLFVHRPDFYPNSTRPEIAEVIVAKSHYGQPRVSYVVYQPGVCRFDTLPVRRPTLRQDS